MYLNLSDVVVPILIIILALIFVIGVFCFIIPFKTRSNVQKKLAKLALENDLKLTVDIEKNYDFLLENENIQLQFKITRIPSNSSVTINNVYTWALRYGGSSKKPGRSYPNQRYMLDVANFISKNLPTKKKVLKVIILYPTTEKIAMYLNESELKIVESTDTPYGYKVIRYVDLEEKFKDLL